MTRRQRWVLQTMAAHADDEDGELVYERGFAYIGDTRIAPRTVFALLRMMAISMSGGEVGGVERYKINSTGLALLARSTEGVT